MIILALALFGVAIWDFVVGMWIAGIIAAVMGIWCIGESIAAYNEDVFW